MSIHSFMEKYDCAVLSAFKTSLTSCDGDEIGFNLNIIDDVSRNKHLKAALMRLGYGVTNIIGNYVQLFLLDNQIDVKEGSFFVVNLSNDPMFIKNIKKLGEVFCQDSVLIFECGGHHNYFVGTNKSNFPGYGEVISVGTFNPATESDLTGFRSQSFSLETWSSIQINSKRVVYEFAKPITDLL
jgi:hypothetical protein